MTFVRKILLILLLQVQASRQACFLGGDIAFVLDISENSSASEEMNTFGTLITKFISNHGRTLMALITYRCEAMLRFSFDDWTTSESHDAYFEVFAYLNAIGNQTHRGMNLLREKVFSKHYGARAKTEKVVVLVTDRPSSDILESEKRATRLKDDGVTIFAVAIGNEVTDEEIKLYATGTLRIDGFDQMEMAFNKLKNLAFDCAPCDEGWIPSIPADGKCYQLVTRPMKWQTADDHCDTLRNGSHLVKFDNIGQVEWFLGEYTDPGLTNIWLGIRLDELTGEFKYSVDLTPLDTNIISWKEGDYPSKGACVHFSADGRMADERCDAELQSVCQIDMNERR